MNHFSIFMFSFLISIIVVVAIILCSFVQAQEQHPTPSPPPSYSYYQQHYSVASTISEPYQHGNYLLKLGLADLKKEDFDAEQTFAAHSLLVAKVSDSDSSDSEKDKTSTSSSSSPQFGHVCSSTNNLEINQPEIADTLCRSVGFAWGRFWIKNFTVAPTNSNSNNILFKNINCKDKASDFTQCGISSFSNDDQSSSSSSCNRIIALNCSYGFSRGWEFRLTPSWRVETRYFRSWAYTNIKIHNNSKSGNDNNNDLPILRINPFTRVCDDHWVPSTSHALCRTMGYFWPANSSFTSESTRTSSILYSKDDSTSIGMDNVHCSRYQYNPTPYGNNFDSCSFSSTTHNCLSRYESLVIDCLGNKHIKNSNGNNNDGGTGGSGGKYPGGDSGYGNNFGVKKESLLVFACVSLFLFCSVFCCYKMLLRRKIERQAAMHAIREGRIQGMSGPNQLALLEHAFGLHADSEENILAQTRNREFEHETGQEMSERNDENHNNTETFRNPLLFRTMMMNRDRSGGTFMMPPVSSPSSSPRRNRAQSSSSSMNRLSRGGESIVSLASALAHYRSNNNSRDSSPTVVVGSSMSSSTTPDRFRAIPLIAEARVATPTVGVVTPRGGRQRSYSSPASQSPRSFTTTSQSPLSGHFEQQDHGEDEEEEEEFMLPPRGYDSPPKTKSSQMEDESSKLNDDDDDDDDEGDRSRHHQNFSLRIPSSSPVEKQQDERDDDEDISGVDSIFVRQQQSTTASPNDEDEKKKKKKVKEENDGDDEAERLLEF